MEDGDGVRGRERVSSGAEAREGASRAGRGRLYAPLLTPGVRQALGREGAGLCRQGLATSSACASGLLAGLPFIDSVVALREDVCAARGPHAWAEALLSS